MPDEPASELTVGPLSKRLEGYLAEAHPLLQRQEPASRPAITASQVRRAVGEISVPLRKALSAGAFMNVWTAAGLKRNELRNAAVLAWLLDPTGTHGLDDLVARSFFGRLRRPPGWLLRKSEFQNMSVRTEEQPLGSRENRVDISIADSDFLVFVEVKIDAREGDRQLERYLEEMKLKAGSHGGRQTAVVYLTIDGEAPAGAAACPTIAWRDVEQGLEAVARALSATDMRRSMLLQFAEHIRSF